MIGFSRLGKKGNLGNQLFQIASTIGIAKQNRQPYCFPLWKYSSYFQFKIPVGDSSNYKRYHEKQFNYYPIELPKGNYDLLGYFQTEKYFDIPYTKEIFSFEEEFLDKIIAKSSLISNPENILISVRRGDFVHHPWFFQLSYKFYLKALIYNFPDWKTRNLIFTSDDIEYCKYHFSSLDNSYFLDDLSDIEQIAFASFCKDFIISNSTFSWWMAWLGEKENSKIIRPWQYFKGVHGKKVKEKDYFPERWIRFDHRKRQLPLYFFKIIVKGELYRVFNTSKFYSKKILNSIRSKGF